MGAGGDQQARGGREGEAQQPSAVLAGQQARRGGGQPQAGGVDVPGEERQRTGAADEDGRGLAGQVGGVEEHQPDDHRGVAAQRAVAVQAQQSDEDEHVAQQLADHDVEADLAEYGDETGVPMLQVEVEREARRRGGDQERHVGQQRTDELCGEEHQHREQRRELYGSAGGCSGRRHWAGSWQEG
ncbi:hypothetical protein GCM10020000_54850 [Streptomyces olivoverticillatus]